jgi:hypothetical protein
MSRESANSRKRDAKWWPSATSAWKEGADYNSLITNSLRAQSWHGNEFYASSSRMAQQLPPEAIMCFKVGKVKTGETAKEVIT